MKIIIDTDPGIDDAMAIFYGHAAPEIELLGLTTVFGNVHVEQATRNAHFLLGMMDKDLPVAQGAGIPMNGVPINPSKHVHGNEGFGTFTDVPEYSDNCDENAAEFLVRMAREHKGELVVCAIAPLTNIADAIELDPEFASNLSRLVIMGGAVDCPGNVTKHAEANIYHDVVAAQKVLSSDCEIVLVGLDVTLQTLCKPEDFSKMKQNSPRLGGFIDEIGKFYLDFYRDVVGVEGCGLHDSTALIACTHPELFETESLHIDVVQDGEAIGATRRFSKPSSNKISVCLDVDARAVDKLFLERMCTNS